MAFVFVSPYVLQCHVLHAFFTVTQLIYVICEREGPGDHSAAPLMDFIDDHQFTLNSKLKII